MVVVIFEVHPKPKQRDACLGYAQMLRPAIGGEFVAAALLDLNIPSNVGLVHPSTLSLGEDLYQTGIRCSIDNFRSWVVT